MKNTNRTLIAAVSLIAAVTAACGSSSGAAPGSAATGTTGGASGATSLIGAGATFPQPIYSKWSGDYKTATAVQVNYQGVGSGAGIQQFTAKTVDFGATDAPMSDAEITTAAAAGGDVLHIPMVLGAVVVTYNLPGVTGLKLDGPTLASIFLGTITTWSDPAIAALNAGVTLPATPITVVHRSDGSGTSFVFTGYLAAVSPDWASKVGQNKAPEWPVGQGAEKNDGVAAQVKATAGAIGYNELSYALTNAIPFASLKNKAGEFVTASLESTTAAGSGTTYPPDLRFSLLDSASAGAYPIVSATWQLVWKDPSKAGQSASVAAALKAWLAWELTDGQKTASTLNYAPLPSDLQTLALAAATSIVG